MNLMALGESMLKDDVSLNNNCDIEAWKRKEKTLSFSFSSITRSSTRTSIERKDLKGSFKKKIQKIKGTSAK